jgi:hypothetical protein
LRSARQLATRFGQLGKQRFTFVLQAVQIILFASSLAAGMLPLIARLPVVTHP